MRRKIRLFVVNIDKANRESIIEIIRAYADEIASIMSYLHEAFIATSTVNEIHDFPFTFAEQVQGTPNPGPGNSYTKIARDPVKAFGRKTQHCHCSYRTWPSRNRDTRHNHPGLQPVQSRRRLYCRNPQYRT